ncbi:hypothetical protein Ga0451573_000288 [Peptococcaceae bacterium DYL19]|nr:hypothetical protein [Phosphitispora fastidiosa]
MTVFAQRWVNKPVSYDYGKVIDLRGLKGKSIISAESGL